MVMMMMMMMMMMTMTMTMTMTMMMIIIIIIIIKIIIIKIIIIEIIIIIIIIIIIKIIWDLVAHWLSRYSFQPEGRGFDSRFSRQVGGTLGKSLTHSCLWLFGVKLRHSIRAVSGAPLSSSGLEEAL